MKIDYEAAAVVARLVGGTYLGDWKGYDRDKVASEYNADLTDVNILLAHYSYEDYSGSSYVLFTENGRLYEVYGSHCSCYGLEDQWEPEETSFDVIAQTIDTNYNYHNVRDELRALIEGWKNPQ